MKKFQYVRQGYEYADELGRVGWEAVGVFPNTGSILFKREIIEQQEEENFTLMPAKSYTPSKFGYHWFRAPSTLARNDHKAILAYINERYHGYGRILRIIQEDIRDCGSTGLINYFCETEKNAQ